jgi:hypothetical protein
LDDVRLAGAAADRSGGAGSSGLSRPDILGSSCNRVGIVQLTISNWIVQNIDDVEKKKLSERAFRFGLLEKCRTVTWECQVFCCKIGLYNYNQ